MTGAITMILKEAVHTLHGVVQDGLTKTAITRTTDPPAMTAEIKVGVAIGTEVVVTAAADNGTARPTTGDPLVGR